MKTENKEIDWKIQGSSAKRITRNRVSAVVLKNTGVKILSYGKCEAMNVPTKYGMIVDERKRSALICYSLPGQIYNVYTTVIRGDEKRTFWVKENVVTSGDALENVLRLATCCSRERSVLFRYRSWICL